MTTIIPTPAPVPNPLSSDFGSKAYDFTLWMAEAAPAMQAVGEEMNAALNNSLLGVTTTSTTSLTIATGAQSLTVGTGLGIAVGMPLKITRTSDVTKYMKGVVTSYNSGTGALNLAVATIGGSGTFTNWTIVFDVPTSASQIPFGGLIAAPVALGNSFTEGSFSYLKTGVTALSSAYPSAPAVAVGDGIVWSAKTLATTITTPNIVGYGNGRLIVMNSGADYGVSDDNGLTFQLRNTPAAMQVTEGSLAWGYSQVWMWMNTLGTLAYISYDNGDTWVPITNPNNGTHVVDNRNLIYAAGKWVSVGNSGTASIKYSTDDGLTWTAPTQNAAANGSIAYGNGLFVVHGAAGNQYTQVSSDAITWTYYATAVPVGANAVHFANGVFVATAQAASTSIYTSSNGQSFSAQTMPSSQTWRGMCVYNGTFFVSAAVAGTVGATSTNMTTFTARTLVSGDGTYTNSAVGNGFVAFRGSVNYAVSSTGGLNYVNNFVALYADALGNFPLYMRVA